MRKVGSIRGIEAITLEMTPINPTNPRETWIFPKKYIGSQKSATFFRVSQMRGALLAFLYGKDQKIVNRGNIRSDTGLFLFWI